MACAGLGAVLSAATGVSALDGYLATTPGGLYAVLATASDSGADVTFVLAVQVLRLFVMLSPRAGPVALMSSSRRRAIAGWRVLPWPGASAYLARPAYPATDRARRRS